MAPSSAVASSKLIHGGLRYLEQGHPAARRMAEPLGWDVETTAQEVEVYRGRVADLERLSAPDVLTRR